MPSSARVFITRHCTLSNCGRLLDTSLEISTPLKYVKGVGPKRAEMLETKGLLTVEDLLGYAPFRYEDHSNVKTIAELAPAEVSTVIAEVKSTKLTGFRGRNLGLVETIFTDSSSEMLRGNWFRPNGGYLAAQITTRLQSA